MKRIILFLVILISVVAPRSVYAEVNKPLDVCNTSHRIAVIATVTGDEVATILKQLSDILPYGFKLFRVCL